jgi:hypothetical protein
MLASCRETGCTVSAPAAFIFPRNKPSAEESRQSLDCGLWTVGSPSGSRGKRVTPTWSPYGKADPGKKAVHPTHLTTNHATPGARFIKSAVPLQYGTVRLRETHRLSKLHRSPLEPICQPAGRLVAAEKRKRVGPESHGADPPEQTAPAGQLIPGRDARRNRGLPTAGP